MTSASSIGRRKYDPPPAVACGLNRKPTRVTSGAMSLSNSTHFPVIDDSKRSPTENDPGEVWSRRSYRPVGRRAIYLRGDVPAGMGEARDEALANGVGDRHKYNGNVAGLPQQGCHNRTRVGDDHLGP
jgi:hypothetical protein